MIIDRFLTPVVEQFRRPQDTRSVAWVDITTNKHELQMAVVHYADIATFGGAIEQVGDNILIVSPQGRFRYLASDYTLHAMDMPLNMHLDELRDAPFFDDVMFDVTWVRAHDLLALPAGANTYDLYASFNRYEESCFSLVVARLRLEAEGSTLRPLGEWQDVWRANPCVPLNERGEMFAGEASGGRLVRMSEDTLLVSVGDFMFDGVYGGNGWRAPMEASNDFGKIIALNIRTGASRHFAIGLRNPQGLLVARDGSIWESEHGPQGGDEINHMVEGGNYGWPLVTYGMAYGSPPTNWPLNASVGSHDGYRRPSFAFVPSVGISSMVEPNLSEFPNWTNSLLVGSMKGAALYVLRREGHDIVFAEPIRLERRLRDIVSLRDGRLAILFDSGDIGLIRNAALHRDEPREFVVSGYLSLPPPLPEEASPPPEMDPVERGRLVFRNACAGCHGLQDEAGVGPSLDGVMGRRIASHAAFGYSASLAERGDGVWTAASMEDFLLNPAAYAPGTAMPSTNLSSRDIAAVVAYLGATERQPREERR